MSCASIVLLDISLILHDITWYKQELIFDTSYIVIMVASLDN
jgi:hypothetical protein